MRKRPCLTADDTKTMMAACIETAAQNKWNVSIAIVDEHGVLLGFVRMDGAAFSSAEVSVAKARTAAIWRRSTKFWEGNVKDRLVLMKMPDNLPVTGGVPGLSEDEVVGAIGVSGVRSDQDEQIALAGLAAIGLTAGS
jgi:glc operon protein GlcG